MSSAWSNHFGSDGRPVMVDVSAKPATARRALAEGWVLMSSAALQAALAGTAKGDVPAIAETLPGYETYSWNALFAPAGTPPEAVARLNAAAVAAMADPAVVARMGEFSASIVASSPEELAQHVKAEMTKWEPVVTDANVTMD